MKLLPTLRLQYIGFCCAAPARRKALPVMYDPKMVKLVGFAGSLRQGSYNRKLLEAAARSVPADATLEIFPIDAIPLYNADVEAASGIPQAVTALKEG